MGREIRRVPPNWKHPQREYCPHRPQCSYGPDRACYHPMRDEPYDKAAMEWVADFKKFKPKKDAKYFWDWYGMPPERDYYRPNWKPKEATWFQVYETVSEGTPVTPPFATQAELIDYLATHGDFWDQRRGDGPWSRQNAEQFVKDEYAPSMITIPGKGTFASKDTPTASRPKGHGKEERRDD